MGKEKTDPPKCSLCETRHYAREPHDLTRKRKPPKSGSRHKKRTIH